MLYRKHLADAVKCCVCHGHSSDHNFKPRFFACSFICSSVIAWSYSQIMLRVVVPKCSEFAGVFFVQRSLVGRSFADTS